MDCELCNEVKKASYIIASNNILMYVCKEHGYKMVEKGFKLEKLISEA